MTEDNKVDIKLKDTSDRVASLDAESLIAMLEAAYELRHAMQLNEPGVEESINDKKTMLLVLLEYLALNEDNPNLDPQIFAFLNKLFGRELTKKKKEREKEDEEELEGEGVDEDLNPEEKKRRARLYIYEVYKITNPNRIAGETEMDNFIKNVKTRGIAVACKYEGMEHWRDFSSEEVKNMESYRSLVKQRVIDAGSREMSL